MTTPVPDPLESPDHDGVETVLHRERVRIAVERYPTERVSIRTVIVEEERTFTVTVRREELRIVREPVPDGTALPGPESPQPAEIVITLHEEHPVVALEVRPVERVRIMRHVETVLETVTETVGREKATITSSPRL